MMVVLFAGKVNTGYCQDIVPFSYESVRGSKMKWKSNGAAIIALIMSPGCSDARSEYEDSAYEDSLAASEDSARSPEADDGDYLAEPASDADSPSEFHGYDCTQDCSGHEAGYAWAEDKGVVDAEDCGGSSQSFEEGCRAYADQQ